MLPCFCLLDHVYHVFGCRKGGLLCLLDHVYHVFGCRKGGLLFQVQGHQFAKYTSAVLGADLFGHISSPMQ